ncbi:phage minor head protein [Methylopila sp. M107]|uniref:phage head morphogenesis protein n=1 Tax=Methylopila sp. M107 TaxID=1101190 RepID=UPI00037356D5|nr:phage minor head protein [Methylopila sp. M107]
MADEPPIAAPAPRKGFATPPEVLRYFREKRQAPRFSWLDVFAEEHARAFTVAKAVETELLDAFRTSIDGALERGEGFETWKKQIEADIRRLGWWGPREVKDPELRDRTRKVDFSRPRRLRTIFWSNMNAARAAGQWDRIQRTKKALPFLLYVRTTASDPRPEHLRWAGIILHADDPFWRTHFPPNGWGCKCTVRQITRREGDALLAKGEQRLPGPDGQDAVVSYRSKAPDDGPPKTFRNRRTGATAKIPAGLDPGWHTNPGLARAETLTDKLAETLAASDEPTARAQIASMIASTDLGVLAKLPERARLPVAVASQVAEELGAKSAIVSMSNDTLVAKMARHGFGLEAAAHVQTIVDEGEPTPDRSGASARSLVGSIGDQLWRLALGLSRDGFLYVRTLHPFSPRRLAKILRDRDDRED